MTQTKCHTSEVSAVMEMIAMMTNPFDPSLKHFVNIASGEVALPCVKQDMLAAKQIGEEKFNDFVNLTVRADVPDVFSASTRVNLKTFTKKEVKSRVSMMNGKVVELRNDARFISRLLAIGESREIDMQNLMHYSLRKFPATFATPDGNLVKSPKCKLLHDVVNRVDDPTVEITPKEGALLLDAMAILQTLKDVPQTFGDLAEKIFQLMVKCAKAAQATRIDFVSDRYPSVSIKNLERCKRAASGVTQIRLGGPNQKVPCQLKKFLSLGKNKESLIEFVFNHLCTKQLQGKLHNLSFYFTHGQKCHRFFVDNANKARIEEVLELYSDHEEADTRLLLHAKNASTSCEAVTIRSPYMDVFILMLGHKSSLDASLYFDTGSGNQRRLFDVNNVYRQLGAEFCEALLGFHAFTGIFLYTKEKFII